MSPLEAKKIIAALADGIDPETGQNLPEQSIFNRPQVIRALFVATRALERAAKQQHRGSLPDHAGRAWSDTEDKDLLAAFDAGIPSKDIAVKHGRSQGAIASRLVRLGRIKERAEVYVRPKRVVPDDGQQAAGGTTRY